MRAPGTGHLLSDAQRFDWLRLLRCDGVGPRTFRALVNRYGSAGAALKALPDLARAKGRAVQLAPERIVAAELEEARRRGIALIAMGEPDYPPALAAIDDAPPLIAVRGQVAVLRRPMAALVGSRNASGVGRRLAMMLAQGLGVAGFATVSGLARGIDAAVHQASLDSGTVAVLAGGLDRIYPPEHGELAERICERGALIGEMPIGWEARGRDFPRRNRIIAGLALGTVVVEAALRSGSLITARFANEQGRLVFAVPGSPLDPRAEGANQLLADGATIARSAQDVVLALTPLMEADAAPPPRRSGADDDAAVALWDELIPDMPAPFAPLPDEGEEFTASAEPLGERALVMDLIGPAPIGIDDLARLSALPTGRLHAVLVDLELEGAIRRGSNQTVSLR